MTTAPRFSRYIYALTDRATRIVPLHADFFAAFSSASSARFLCSAIARCTISPFASTNQASFFNTVGSHAGPPQVSQILNTPGSSFSMKVPGGTCFNLAPKCPHQGHFARRLTLCQYAAVSCLLHHATANLNHVRITLRYFRKSCRLTCGAPPFDGPPN